MRALLAIRDARLYLAGQACSLLGDSALVLVLMIWVKELTGSSGAAGLVVFAFVAATLVGPAAGLLVDRVRRRPLLIVANGLSALAVLPLLAVHGRGDVAIIYLVAALYGLSYATIASGQSALLATLLPAELLAPANGALQTVREGLRLVAPLLGAGLFAAFGATPVVLLDAATFLLAAAALAAMRFREPAPAGAGLRGGAWSRGRREGAVDRCRRGRDGVSDRAEFGPDGASLRSAREPDRRERWWDDIAAGARHVLGDRPLRRMTLCVAAATAVIGFCESVLFEIVAHGLQRPPSFVGVVMVVQGAGAVVGGLSAAAFAGRFGEARLTTAGMAVFAAGCGAETAGAAPVILAGVVAFGLGIPWIVVGQTTLLQRRTPAALQGRAFSAMDVLTGTPQTLSIVVGAVLVGLVDYRLLLAAMALVVAGAGWTLALPERPADPHRRPSRLPLSGRTSRFAGSARRRR